MYLGLSGKAWRISHCLVYDNTAEWAGGMHVLADDVQVTNCTMVDNRALDQWGGVMCDRGETRFLQCVFWGNVCDQCGHPDVEWAQIGRDDGCARFDYCCVQGWTGEFAGDGTIDTDPLFADAENKDYHLRSQAGRWDPLQGNWVQDEVTSPCIDAGDPSTPIMHEPFPNGGIANMGAYGGTAEASKSWFGVPVCEIIVTGDINGDCSVNLADFALMAGHWLEEQGG